MTATSPQRWRWRAVAGIAIGALALYSSFRGVNRAELRSAFHSLPWPFILATVTLVLATIAVVTWRWRVIFKASGRVPRWRDLSAGVLIGQTMNILLPFRTGELARGYAVSRSSDVPLPHALATIAVERLADVAAAGFSTALLLWSVRFPETVAASAGRLIVVGLVGIVLVVGGGFWAEHGFRFAVRLLERMGVPLPRSIAAAESALAGLAALRQWRPALWLGLLTFCITALAAVTNYILFRGFGLDVPVLAALVLLIALQVGTTVASVPGNLGVFHYVTILVLAAYGIDRATALAYAWTLYVLTVTPRVLLGAAVMMAVGRK